MRNKFVFISIVFLLFTNCLNKENHRKSKYDLIVIKRMDPYISIIISLDCYSFNNQFSDIESAEKIIVRDKRTIKKLEENFSHAKLLPGFKNVDTRAVISFYKNNHVVDSVCAGNGLFKHKNKVYEMNDTLFHLIYGEKAILKQQDKN